MTTIGLLVLLALGTLLVLVGVYVVWESSRAYALERLSRGVRDVVLGAAVVFTMVAFLVIVIR